MWTDFCQASEKAMLEARTQMNDYRLIMMGQDRILTPHETVKMHDVFVEKIRHWFSSVLTGARVVITHYAPVVNSNTKYGNSSLMPAFNSLDMIAIIETHQPALWVYGHTHECDNQSKGTNHF